jgi:hypothetical protein
VPFAENAPVIADQVDSKDSSVFDLECEWQTNPIRRIMSWIEIDGAFDTMKARNGQTGVIDERLMARDRVVDRPQSRSVQDQFSMACDLFDEFHHLSVITRLSRTIQ